MCEGRLGGGEGRLGGGWVMMIDCFVIHLVFMGPLPVANRARNISLHMSYDNLSLVNNATDLSSSSHS